MRASECIKCEKNEYVSNSTLEIKFRSIERDRERERKRERERERECV